ncbi:MAG: hypothetical protein ABIS36_19545 [Chryseolinea sp.]
MINEIICDNILRKFEGNKSISWERLKDKEFYFNIDPDFHVVQEHINFLIKDRTLREVDAAVSLTTKGWFILTNAEKVGYVARRIENAQWEKSERDRRIALLWAAAIAAAAIVSWIAVKFILN